MKRVLIAVTAASIVGLVVYFFGYIFPSVNLGFREGIVNRSNCNDQQMAEKEHVVGVVKQKFNDTENHMWQTVEYANKFGSQTTLIFRNDRSNAYEYIMPGDSIFKEAGSKTLIIKRLGKETNYQLKYECK